LTAATFLPVIEDPAAATPAWLTEALTRGGTPATVSAVAYEKIGTGQTGACFRLRLTHDGRAPDTLVLKTVAGDAEQRAKVQRAYRAEVAFYQTFAPITRVRTPRCYHAALAEDGLGFSLLLEDAAPAVAGLQEQGCTLEQAVAAIRNLAGLHGPLWNSPALAKAAWMATDATRAARLAPLHAMATERLIERYRDDLLLNEAAALRGVTQFTEAWLQGRDGPRVLVHGDYRLDNLLFAPDGAVLAVDWQTLELGQPGRDVAYFLATALSREVRQAHEVELLAVYHDQLMTYGVADYSLEDCRAGYRRGMLQAAYTTSIGCMLATGERNPASDAMFISMARRAAQALEDLQVADALRDLDRQAVG
jgi:aminoglycoside phosphotransferase (APT) family kinase protein